MDQTAPTTMPLDTPLFVVGFDVEHPRVQQLAQVLMDIANEWGTQVDLWPLCGITIGSDYDASLASVDLGYVSTVAKQYTNSGGMQGVAKTLRVRRDGIVRAHVVFSDCLAPLLDPDHDNHHITLNLVLHELSHVAVLGWLEANTPNTYLQAVKGDWATARMRDWALTLWEEYAVCRLTAGIGTDPVQATLAENVELSSVEAAPLITASVATFQIHHDVARAFAESGAAVAGPLRSLAYLLGHLDGAQRNLSLSSLCPSFSASALAPFSAPLRDALRALWDQRAHWSSFNDLDGIVAVLVDAMAAVGVTVLLKDSPPGTWVNVAPP